MFVLIVLGCSIAASCQASNVIISGIMKKLLTFDDNLPLSSVCYITNLDDSSPIHCISYCLVRLEVCRGIVFNHEQKTCKLLKCNPKENTTAGLYETGKWDLFRRTDDVCKHGWVKHLDYCYFFSSVFDNWWNAKGVCEEKGGSLASIRSSEELTWIADYCFTNQAHFPLCWIGGFYNATQRNYVWVSDHSTIDVVNWSPGEPHFIYECVAVYQDKKLNSERCLFQYPYICESPTM